MSDAYVLPSAPGKVLSTEAASRILAQHVGDYARGQVDALGLFVELLLGDKLGTLRGDLVQASATSGAANRWYFARLTGAPRTAAALVRYFVGTTGGNMHLALYGNTGSGRSAAPNLGGLKWSSGSFAVPTAAVATKAISPATSIAPGDWVGLAADGTTAAFGSTSQVVRDASLIAGEAWQLDAANITAAPTSGTLSATARKFGLFIE